jgi:hypothetical protein
MLSRRFLPLLATAALLSPVWATHGPDVGLHPGYDLMTIRPDSFRPAVAGMEFLPNGDLLVLTWRGNTGPSATQPGTGIPMVGTRNGTAKLYRLTNVKGTDRAAITVTEVASGFKDAQGLTVVNGDIYVGDIDRIVKLVDNNADGKYETFQEVGKLPSYDGWFEYAFGPVHKEGKLYMALAVGVKMSGDTVRQMGPGRGTVVSVPIAGGTYSVVAAGLRAPDGIGIGPDNDIFVTDNQGGFRPSSQFHQVVQGRFYGYFLMPPDPIQTSSGGKVTPPAIWTPHAEANESPTEPYLMSAGAFKGQFIYGDIGRGGIYRAFLEKVKGEWQGAVFCMSGGLEVGVHRVRTGAAGEIYVGGLGNGGHSNQGWNSTTFGLQKLTPKPGVTTFEILSVRSRAGGMELEFTKPVAAGAAAAARYAVWQWRYTPTSSYGGNKVENQQRTVSKVELSPDKKKVFLEIAGLKTGQIVFINTNGITAETGGEELWYKKTWYTLNQMSDSKPFEEPTDVRIDPPQYLKTDLRIERLAGALRTEWPGEAAFRLELADLHGAVVARTASVGGKATLAVRGLPSGVYVVRAYGAGKAMRSKPVLF